MNLSGVIGRKGEPIPIARKGFDEIIPKEFKVPSQNLLIETH